MFNLKTFYKNQTITAGLTKPLLHSPLSTIFPPDTPVPTMKESDRYDKTSDPIVNLIDILMDTESHGESEMNLMNALFMSNPALAAFRESYTDVEDYKDRVAEDYIDLLQGNLWAGGMVGGKFAPLFDLANAAMYHGRGIPSARNMAVISSLIPTIAPRSMSFGNETLDKYLGMNLYNKFLAPKVGDDIVRDVIRGRSGKFDDLGRELSGHMFTGAMKPHVGRFFTKNKMPFGFEMGSLWDAVKKDPRAAFKRAFAGDDVAWYTTSGKTGERAYHPGTGPSVAETAARWHLNRRLWGLPPKPFKYWSKTKKGADAKGIDNFDWDNVEVKELTDRQIFSEVREPNITNPADIPYSKSGGLLKFGGDRLGYRGQQHGDYLSDKWLGPGLMPTVPGATPSYQVVGHFGHETQSGLSPMISLLDAQGKSLNIQMPLYNRLFDIWDLDLNATTKLDYIKKLFHSPTNFVRGVGSSAFDLTPPKIIKDLAPEESLLLADRMLRSNQIPGGPKLWEDMGGVILDDAGDILGQTISPFSLKRQSPIGGQKFTFNTKPIPELGIEGGVRTGTYPMVEDVFPGLRRNLHTRGVDPLELYMNYTLKDYMTGTLKKRPNYGPGKLRSKDW